MKRCIKFIKSLIALVKWWEEEQEYRIYLEHKDGHVTKIHNSYLTLKLEFPEIVCKEISKDDFPEIAKMIIYKLFYVDYADKFAIYKEVVEKNV